MNRKKILLDVDEVICFSGFLEAVNEFLDTNYTIDDFTDYYIDEVAIPKERLDEFNQFVASRNAYKNPIMLPDAIKTIERLNSYYDIFICTSCVNPFDPLESGETMKKKFLFLMEYLPFINPNNYIFTSSKGLIKGDIIIDDRLPNLDTDIETKILFPSYHNKDISEIELEEKGIIRAGYNWRTGWKEVEKILIKK
ncbi:hypothetical protein [uncultured Methanobrevibacter sp.]|uniref:5' nucleotidase, NT5C type n=1 Tax=uncultured Methanobrevibacter sp. TaxID=253161 RepID=UPI0025F96341|nr:hypothetical protein [uncultured Methanobrevibacter sp.]